MSGKTISIVCGALAIAALVVAFTFTPGQVDKVMAQAATVVYNLYATDGYIEMADGLPVYSYGFIGSREGVDFTYTTSYCTGDGVTRTCARPTNVLVPGGAVAPMGGPWTGTGQDAQFAGNAQFPAPIVYATVNDVVEIRLKNLGVTAQPNAPNDPHSIHLHGLDVDAANDGVPETSLGAVPANLCADGSTAANGDCTAAGGPAPGAGNVIVYMFSPEYAGTYMYHCHQEADIHVNMGMFGALVVYNQGDPAALTGPGMGMGGTLYELQYDKDFVLLLGEFDIRGHADEEGTYVPVGEGDPAVLPKAHSWDPDPFNWALYEPQYWFINGISFPNTIHADFPSTYTFAEWLAAHPGYDPLITASVSTPNAFWGTPGEKVLIRVINMGFETQPMHMHGYHGKVIGSDQRAWDWANSWNPNKGKGTPFGQGLEKNTLTIGSGETYDWLVDFGQQAFADAVYPPGSIPPSLDATESRYNNTLVDMVLDDGITVVKVFADSPCVTTGVPLNAPVSNTETQCPAIPIDGATVEYVIGGVPYVGPDPAVYIGGPTVTGIFGSADPAGPGIDFAGYAATSQYFPFHNHDDYKATNDGVYPGGMFTMIVPTP